MEAAVIITNRCNQKCTVCRIWQYPSKREEEFQPSLLERLPQLSFCNITGGEPFLREDLDDIVTILKRKAKRIVISTNGYLTERILDLAGRQRNIGIRISLEGPPAVNDKLRGVKGGFDRGLRTLKELRKLEIRDLGIAITVSDANHKGMLELFHLSRELGVEFATAVIHNSFYFHTYDNCLENTEDILGSFQDLIRQLMRSRRLKNWYRAYFNFGLMEYIQGHSRLLPCPAGTDIFFLDPWGEVYPCNGLEKRFWLDSLGNLHRNTFDQIWHSPKAKEIRAKVSHCPKNCWMIGTASPAMKRNIWKPSAWILKNKFSRLRKENL
ncbi:MAG: radical SAM protein [Desulfobacterales bacterium]|nr:radical SAM protein [Desulfobacterales bacterium]